VAGTLNALVDKAEWRKRKARAPKRKVAGVLEKYAAQVGSAHLGAITHSGGKK